MSRSSPASDELVVDGRTAWPSFNPASHSGYHSAVASVLDPVRLRLVDEHDVDVAERRQLTAAVAADGDERHADLRARGVIRSAASSTGRRARRRSRPTAPGTARARRATVSAITASASGGTGRTSLIRAG